MSPRLVLSIICFSIAYSLNVKDEKWNLLTNGTWDAREGLMGTFYNDYIWLSGGRYSPPDASNISNSTFYNDVWKLDPKCINDIATCKWQLISNNNLWEGRGYHIMLNHTVDSIDYMYVIGGQNLSTFYNDVWRSTDGIKWEQVLPNNNQYWHARAGLAAASNPNDGYIYVSSGCYDEFPNRQTLNDLWRSKDGKEWQQIIANNANSIMHTRSGPRVQILNNILYLVAGEHGFSEVTQLGDVWSVNLLDIDNNQSNVDWNLINNDAAFYNRSGHGFVIDNDGIFWVIAGYYDLHDLWRSTDLGKTWQQVTRRVFNCEETDIHCGRYDFWVQLDDKNNMYVYGGDCNWNTFGGEYNECWEINIDQYP